MVFVLITINGVFAGNTYNISSDMDTSMIQSIIDDVNLVDGDTLNFIDSDYSLNMLKINKSLNIVSKVDSNIKCDSPANINVNEFCFFTNADNINITGFRIHGFPIAIGAPTAYKPNNLQIINNTFVACGQGIITYANNVLIENNTFLNTNSSFTASHVSESQYLQYGITSRGTGVIIIRGNIVTGFKYGIANYAPNALVSYNIVNLSSNEVMLTQTHSAIANTENGHGSIISHNLVENNYNFGIRNDCDNVTILNNTLRNNTVYGIINQNTNHGQTNTGNLVIIQNNIVETTKSRALAGGGPHGIYNTGFGASIINNTVRNNAGNGIHVSSSGNMTIVSANTVYGNNGTSSVGIYFAGSIGLISDNEVYNNQNGVQLLSSLIKLNNNTINNNYGIGLIINFNNSVLNIFNNTLKFNRIAIDIRGDNNTLANMEGTNDYNEISQNYGGIVINGTDNTVKHLNVFLNDNIGVIVLKNNNSVFSCNVFENKVGIHLAANNTQINYNRIFNNKLKGLHNYFDNNDFTLNWWGKNDISDEYEIILGTDNDISNWFVVELSANLFSTIVNDSIIDSIGLVKLSYCLQLFNNDSQDTSFIDTDMLPYYLVNLTWNGIDGDVYKLNNVDAREKYSHNVNLELNNFFSLNALVDNEDVLLLVNPDYLGFVNFTITKITNVTNVTNGEIVTYFITVTNNGPDNATNVVVKEIPQGFLIFQSVNTNGIGFYDSAAGIWDIGNLNIGSTVTLIITFKVNGSFEGNITNVIWISSNEINIGDNQTNATIWLVAPKDTDDNNTTTTDDNNITPIIPNIITPENHITIPLKHPEEDNEMNKNSIATSSVAMKKTGMPMITLVLVLLAIIGFVVRTKEN